jgi:methylated-DNA-[protein]-cysteine S-methyltransferase
MSPLATNVYKLLKKVPKGRVTTYKALGDAVGTHGYRVIGQIMRTNPFAPEVPCHRVVASDGSVGGFMGKTTGKNIQKKIELLRLEGVTIVGNKIADFPNRLFTFS